MTRELMLSLIASKEDDVLVGIYEFHVRIYTNLLFSESVEFEVEFKSLTGEAIQQINVKNLPI